MPAWLSILGIVFKVLVWCYGHDKVLAAAVNAKPLKPDPNPPLSARNDPNQSLPPERGGRPR